MAKTNIQRNNGMCFHMAQKEQWENRYCMGLTRLYQILISEAAYKIWTIQCKRIIGDNSKRRKWLTRTNIVNEQQTQLNLRLRMDCLHTNERKFDRKAISQQKVESTWKGLQRNEGHLPEK
jgi:hypothetical protein